jgi:hypothetical protein
MKSPVRDIASVSNVEMLGDFLNRGELGPLIEKSLWRYGDYFVERDGCGTFSIYARAGSRSRCCRSAPSRDC